MTEEKMLELEASGRSVEIRAVLDDLRQFCRQDAAKNVFLVERKLDHPTFLNIQQLIAHRLLHVLDEAVTPSEAGPRFMALMLDVGAARESAKSVDLFPKEPPPLQAEELKELPIFPLPAKQP
jgi:hypothetical protein